jgi:hypothetical protein
MSKEDLEITASTGPNGASMRPNSEFQRRLVSRFKGKDVIVYSVPPGQPPSITPIRFTSNAKRL